MDWTNLVKTKMAKYLEKTEVDEYFLDCCEIQKILAKHDIPNVSLTICKEIWESYSYSMCAGWLIFPDDEDDFWSQIQSGMHYAGYTIKEDGNE